MPVNKMLTKVTHLVTVLLAGLFIAGCAQVHDFPMGESYTQLREVQILDLEAPERNDGVILSLEGNYGRKVMTAYKGSSVPPSKGSQ